LAHGTTIATPIRISPEPGDDAEQETVVYRSGMSSITQELPPMRAALYLRVSTLNGQSTDNQRLELERVAERHGWQIVEVFEDAGISGARGREQRPAFDRMLKSAVRRDVDVILAWPLQLCLPSRSL
jgi:hypothetical protein